jgi:hypothetical protein
MGRSQFLALKLFALLFFAGSFSSVIAGPLPACGTDNLADYVNNNIYPSGCSIGILDYYDFTYHTVTPGTDPAASAITVMPEVNGFSFGPVSAAANTTVEFEIDYDIYIDPVPRIPGASLNLDPPTGDVTVTEYFCNDVQYVYSGSCLGPAPFTLTVGTPGTGYPSSAVIDFGDNPATTSQQVGILFTLTGGATGASFDGLDAVSIVSSAPEPASAAVLFLGLLTLAGGYKLKRQRNR